MLFNEININLKIFGLLILKSERIHLILTNVNASALMEHVLYSKLNFKLLYGNFSDFMNKGDRTILPYNLIINNWNRSIPNINMLGDWKKTKGRLNYCEIFTYSPYGFSAVVGQTYAFE